ncbi:MAG: glutamate racemase [bacterium]|nr:glutamate racemase [bacterium]
MEPSIGVFDSGFGGLDILRGITEALPGYNYLYLGDTARTPYGTRSKELVYDFTRQAMDFLFEHNCQLVIIACNTASSGALRKIQQEYLPARYPDRNALGVLIPAAEEAVARTKNKKIGVMATPGTVLSNAFVREIKKLDADAQVIQQACPLLVPLVESGEHTSKAAQLILSSYLEPLLKEHVDTIVLGCTHYGILEPQIRSIIGPEISIVSESRAVPPKLKSYLERHPEIEKRIGTSGILSFYSTDLTPSFNELGSKFFGKPISALKAELR